MISRESRNLCNRELDKFGNLDKIFKKCTANNSFNSRDLGPEFILL